MTLTKQNLSRLFYQPTTLAIFLAVGFILNVWGVPLFDVDEGAFSEATREMLTSGIWSATYLDGQPRYDKPILTYWFQALFVKAFGLNEFALRMHSVISALLWAAAIFYFCQQFISRKSAFVATLIFSSTLWITLIGRAATADALLNLFIALTFFDIYRYAQSQNKWHCYRAWLWLSLGVLTKGPVAIAIPGAASLIWFVSNKQFNLWLKAIFNPVGWLILLAVVSPWLYMVWLEQGSGFFHGFLVEHNLKRFTDTKEGHGGQWYYYIYVLPLILLPFSGGLFKQISLSKSLIKDPLDRLLVIWFVVVFILVSFSQTQLPHYVLYGVTPVIILMAKYRNSLLAGKWQLLFPMLFCLIQFVLIYIAPDLANNNNHYQQQMLANADKVFNNSYLFNSILLSLLLLTLIILPAKSWQKLVSFAFCQSVFCYLVLLPAIAQIQQQPIKQAALFAKEIKQEFVAYKMHMPSFSVYREQITHRREVTAGDYVYTRADRISQLEEKFGAEAVDIFYQQGGIVLAQIAGNKLAQKDTNYEVGSSEVK
ncbi:ArnT family glycosyltransferase [Catenovulum sp. SX2]|uniref:ArnT family glycosyltransferase n=1 Tax=Catenovulum sp. SX2 TaxID=3398614 RepID=UPI003F835DE1